MDFFCVDAPPPEIHCERAEDDDSDAKIMETVSDDVYLDGYEAGKDLREAGLPQVSPAMGMRACALAYPAVAAFRITRHATDAGSSEAAEDYEAACGRFLEATRDALAGMSGWKEPGEKSE